MIINGSIMLFFCQQKCVSTLYLGVRILHDVWVRCQHICYVYFRKNIHLNLLNANRCFNMLVFLDKQVAERRILAPPSGSWILAALRRRRPDSADNNRYVMPPRRLRLAAAPRRVAVD